MTAEGARPPLSRDEFIEWVRQEGEHRYHDHHRYHALMHDGKLTQLQLQQWVLNRYYYQTRVPIKDAIILSKSEDPAFRRYPMRSFPSDLSIRAVAETMLPALETAITRHFAATAIRCTRRYRGPSVIQCRGRSLRTLPLQWVRLATRLDRYSR